MQRSVIYSASAITLFISAGWATIAVAETKPPQVPSKKLVISPGSATIAGAKTVPPQAPGKKEPGTKAEGPPQGGPSGAQSGMPAGALPEATGSAAINANLKGSSMTNRTDTAAPITAVNSAAGEARQDAAKGIGSNAAQRPAFDQGFQSVDPKAVEQKAEHMKANGNPLTALTGGRATGGAGPTGVAGQGISAVSSGGLTSATGSRTSSSGNVSSPLTAAQAEAAARSSGVNVSGTGVMGAYSSVGSGPAADIMKAIDADGAPGTPAAAPAAATPETPLNTAANPNFKVFPSGASSEKSNGGNTTTYTSADGKEVIKSTKDPAAGTTTIVKTTTDSEGKATTTTTTAATATAGTSCQGIDGCNDTAGKQQFMAANPGIAAQVNQARNGAAGGTINPNQDNVAIDRSVPVPTTSQVGRNLFGQPGAPGTSSTGGSGAGEGFNGNMGAIDPGPDQTISGQGRQDNPADVFGTQPGPAQGAVQAPPATNSSCDSTTEGSGTSGASGAETVAVAKDDCPE